MIDDLPPGHPVTSGQYTAWTPPMRSLAEHLQRWLFGYFVGTVIVGLAGTGKTTAIRSILPRLRTRHGSSVPCIFYSAKNDGIRTDKKFWESILFRMGDRSNTRLNASQKFHRLVGWLADEVGTSELQKVVLAIDECQRLRTMQYEWLTDLYNELDLSDIRLSVVLIGSPQMNDIVENFSAPNSAHIRRRFMMNIHEFRGIENEKDLRALLTQYDLKLEYPEGSGKSYTANFLPEAFQDGYRLSTLSKSLWKGFCDLRSKHHYRDYPMAFLSCTIGLLLMDYLPRLRTPVEITDEAIRDAIIQGGLISNVKSTQRAISQ